MSSRRPTPRFYVALAGAVLFAGGSGFAISACSSSTSEAPATGDAAPEASGDTGRMGVDAAEAPTDAAKAETHDQCFARCEKTFPKALAKYDAVNKCWDNFCDDPCNKKAPYDAGGMDAEALDGGMRVTDGGGLCGTTFSSDQPQACDDCTTVNCCSEWRGCYNDKDCEALELCYQGCP